MMVKVVGLAGIDKFREINNINNKKKKQKKSTIKNYYCDSDHKPKVEAVYRCPKCREYYCGECAMLSDYECDNHDIPDLVKIKKNKDRED